MNAENNTPEIEEEEMDDATFELLLRGDNWLEQEVVALWQDDEFAELEDGEELEW